MKKNQKCDREFDFALIVGGVDSLTEKVENALFEAGCDDATLSIQHGLLFIEFSRMAATRKDAILSAIHDVRKANIKNAAVLRVDECDLVTQAEIARRIDRSRQLVSQYISGQRGPGGFPPPECHLADNAPLWAWCAVSYWLAQNDMISSEEGWNAAAVAAINNSLEAARQRARNPELIREIVGALSSPP